MRLDPIAVGDIIKASIGGRIVYGEVLEIRDGTVSFTPLTRGSGWRHASAAQVVGHWRRAGRRRASAESENDDAPPQQLSLRLGSDDAFEGTSGERDSL